MTSTSSPAEDSPAVPHAARAGALRDALIASGFGGVLLSEPDNVEFATDYAVRVDANVSHADRWALVPAVGTIVVWEHPAVLSALEPAAADGVELRPAVGLDLLGRHDGEHDAFGAEIAAALARAGVEGQPLAIDALEASGFLSLRRCGLDIRDAAGVLEGAWAALRPSPGRVA
jgi:hypothetical protein